MKISEMEALEKRLSVMRPIKPSQRFFENLEEKIESSDCAGENSTDTLEIEARLRALNPVAPSEKFFRHVEAALDEQNTIAFRHAKTRVFPRWIFAVAVATVAAAGVLIWQVNLENSSNPVGKRAISIASARENVPVASQNFIVAEPKFELQKQPIIISKVIDLSAVRNTRVPAGYQLVETGRNLNHVQALPVVQRADGSVVRPIRYIYTTSSHWENPYEGKTYVEYLPHEELIPTLIPIN